jgi:hypothetical protein
VVLIPKGIGGLALCEESQWQCTCWGASAASVCPGSVAGRQRGPRCCSTPCLSAGGWQLNMLSGQGKAAATWQSLHWAGSN